MSSPFAFPSPYDFSAGADRVATGLSFSGGGVDAGSVSALPEGAGQGGSSQHGSGQRVEHIAFVDLQVPQADQWLAALTADVVVVLDPLQDALQQITTTLGQYQGLQSLSLISHGASGALQLGDTVLDQTALGEGLTSDRAVLLRQWGASLRPGGDLLLYGCNVAAGEAGQQFVQQLALLTGADVAASDDLTGSATLGGDWALEFKTGQIEAGLGLLTGFQQAYAGVLLDWNYSNFANTAGLQTNGIATALNGGLQLTPDTQFQKGSAFYTQAITLAPNTSFSTQFQFKMSGLQGGAGADGLALVLHNEAAGAGALGGDGGALGYAGIGAKSVAIKFDTFDGGAADPNDNHVGFLQGGSLNTIASGTPSFDLNSGGLVNAWVDYDGVTDLLQVYTSQGVSKPVTALFAQTVDLSTLLGGQAYVGFTAATGGRTNTQTIQSWSFNEGVVNTPATVSFQQSTVTVGESGPVASITVLRSGDTTGAASVQYQFAAPTPTPGTSAATAGSDFQLPAGSSPYTLSFAAGETSKTITIPIVDDILVEGTEAFQLVLLNPSSGLSLGPTASTTVSIIDNDSISPPAGGTGLLGEYFDNRDFTALVASRIDSTVNFDWGQGAPLPTMGADTFSVRWTGQVEAATTETYTFYTTSDDGVRLWVNNQLVVNAFVDQSPTERSGSIALTAGQKYNIRLEYYENGGGAVSKLAWSTATIAKQIIPQSRLYTPVGVSFQNSAFTVNEGTPNASITLTRAGDLSQGATVDYQVIGGTTSAADYQNPTGTVTFAAGAATATLLLPIVNDTLLEPAETLQLQLVNPQGTVLGASTTTTLTIIDNDTVVGTGTGLKGEYFDNIDFTAPVLTRTDATINFEWGGGSPAPSIGADTFSVRWTGQIEPQFSEVYTFYTTTDDGVRLWINDVLVIDRNLDQAPTEWSGSIALTAGQKANIRMEYYEKGGGAVAKLLWSSTSTPKQIIPSSQLYAPGGVATIASIALERSDYSINEAGTAVQVALLRTGNTSGTSTIRFRAEPSPAVNGASAADFTPTPTPTTGPAGTLVTFAANETRKVISIPITNDTLIEGTEFFNLFIENPDGATLGTVRTGSVTILDDDSSSLTVSSPQVSEDGLNAVVRLTRSNTTNAASINFATANGTAIAGSDYNATSGVVNFAVGEVSKDILISLINDTIAESNETFTLNFSNPVGVILGATTATVNINDDDAGLRDRPGVISGLSSPTAITWSPDNTQIFILEKSGLVKVASYSNGNFGPVTVFADLSLEVNDVRDRGALGLTLHPNFGQGQGKDFVYVSYTYDPPEAYNNTNPNTNLDDPDQPGNRPSRIVRLTADSTRRKAVQAPVGSLPSIRGRTRTLDQSVLQTVLVGQNSTWANTSRPDGNSTNDFSIAESGRDPNGRGGYTKDYIKTDSESHTIGQLAFGADGTLFASIGDGTSYNAVDVRAASVLNVNSLSGKLLRIDPLTGLGLADNPFWTGDATDNASKVWNLGLRNPFRITVKPGTNTPFLGDVGWKTWEEVNVGVKGANFGWPAYEGGYAGNVNTGVYLSRENPEYKAQLPASVFPSSGSVTAPVFAREHSANQEGAKSIVMGDFYTGTTFPTVYQNALFIIDAGQGVGHALTLDANNNVVASRQFVSNKWGIVQIEMGPDNNLYYVDLGGQNAGAGSIGRWEAF